MDIMKEMQLRMQLMEGKELRFSTSHPGADKRKLVEKAIESLQTYLKQMEEYPEDYEETDTDPWFTLNIELLKVKKPSF